MCNQEIHKFLANGGKHLQNQTLMEHDYFELLTLVMGGGLESNLETFSVLTWDFLGFMGLCTWTCLGVGYWAR